MYAEECWTIFRHHQYRDYMAQTCSIDRVLREVTDITTSFLTHHTPCYMMQSRRRSACESPCVGHPWYSDQVWSALCQGREGSSQAQSLLQCASHVRSNVRAIFCVAFAFGASRYQALVTSTTEAERISIVKLVSRGKNDTDRNGTVFGVRATQQFIVCVFSVVQTRTANLSTLAMRPLLDKVHHVNVDLKSVLPYVKVVETRPYE